MKRKLFLLALIPGLLVGVTFNSFSQKTFEGIASYTSSMNIETLQVAGQNMTPEMQESIRKQLLEQSKRDFTLTFNLQESLWKEEAKLESESPSSHDGGMQIRFSSGNSKSYMNPGANVLLEETEIFGKKFLVEDELERFNWKVSDEKKKIGDYTVVKAEYMDINEQTTMTLNDSEKKTEKVMDTTWITAWYTPEIPVSQGPSNFWGLPGLILELKSGNMTYLCTRIELNPEKSVVIEKPNKGKKVSREEADKIRDEKMEEMMKKFDTGDGGETRVIRIGG